MDKYKNMILSFVLMLVFWTFLFHSWALATTFLVLLAVHEFGHYFASRRLGLDVTPPIFTPLGAMINMREMPKNALSEAVMAYAGPLAGTLGSIAALILGKSIGSQAIFIGGVYSLFLNLFNLIPLSPLDGGRISMAITRHLWVVGALLLVGYIALAVMSGGASFLTLLVLVLIGRFAIDDVQMRSAQARTNPSYFAIGAQARIAFAVAYVGLIALILITLRLA